MPPSEIPPFNVSGVLPPFLANPVDQAGTSPYRTTLVKLVERYGTTQRRLQILWGFLAYRQALMNAGLTQGFQWLDGSFLEDIERTAGRPPGDLDLVNFFRRPLMSSPTRSRVTFSAVTHPRSSPSKATAFVNYEIKTLSVRGH